MLGSVALLPFAHGKAGCMAKELHEKRVCTMAAQRGYYRYLRTPPSKKLFCAFDLDRMNLVEKGMAGRCLKAHLRRAPRAVEQFRDFADAKPHSCTFPYEVKRGRYALVVSARPAH